MEEAFRALLQGQGMPFVLACIAVAYIQRSNGDLLQRLNDERSKHLEALGMQINDLKEAIVECERDRKELWSKIAEQTK